MARPVYERKTISWPLILLVVLITVAIHVGWYFIFSVGGTGFSYDTPLQVRFYHSPSGSFNQAKSRKKIAGKDQKEKKEIEKTNAPTGQVVDIARPRVEKKPDSARFVSEYDSSVEKETRSKADPLIPVRGKSLKRQKYNGPPKKIVTDNLEASTGNGIAPQSGEKEEIKLGAPIVQSDKNGALKKEGKKEGEKGQIIGNSDHNKVGGKEAGRTLPSRFLPYGSGNDGTLSSPSNDYLKDVDESDETALNTKRYVFADYFNRIKRAIGLYWQPVSALIVNDPRGNIYGRQDRYTVLEITLSQKGDILGIKVKTSSGVDVLDREAIEAFKRAAPFPNPPVQLLENGQMKFQFGFFLDTTP